MEIVESLKAELGQVNEKLTALEQIKNDRATLTAQAARLTKAIAMLSGGEPVVRKPMSAEARERIRVGLEKARAAKLAAGTAKPSAAPAPAQPAATAQAQGDTGKKPAKEKGSGRGAN